MLTLPVIEERASQSYIYIPFAVTMRQMQEPAQEGFPKLFAYIEKHGLKQTGAAFYNYKRINMSDTLDVEAGVFVEVAGPEEGEVCNGVLPGGKFVRIDWIGHPDKLMTVTSMLIGWLRETGQELDVEEKADGDHFACRLEIYESDPAEVPDMNDWKTTLAFKLA